MMENQTDLLDRHRDFFAARSTRDVGFRITVLKRLKQAVVHHTDVLNEALWKDLHKSPAESYITEISLVLGEIDFCIKHLKRWTKAQGVPTPLAFFPSKSRIVYEPYGIVLVVAPWNYPFQLLFNPLIGAIAAGNCVVLKPSPLAQHVAGVVRRIIASVFDECHVSVFTGEGEELNRLLEERFDYIFFTGSPVTGREVMKKAACHLTPVTLELGGKCPCIVGKDANVEIAARRIIWGKLLNAGQTCIAPDYLWVHRDRKKELVERMSYYIEAFYGLDPKQSANYPRMINERAVERLIGLIGSSGKILTGGEVDIKEKYVSPTLIDEPDKESLLMQEEIFGPVLPILVYDLIDDVIQDINGRNKPLALYYFGGHQEADRVLKHTSSGGACVNDVILHIANRRLPFGGVGESGIGKYHGYDSFKLFSNVRAIVTSSIWIDVALKYPPYKKWNLLKKIL